MPVTIKPSGHAAESIDPATLTAQTSLARMGQACEVEHQMDLELLQSSFTDPGPITVPSLNGFVWGAIQAYNEHHHLELRPEDIWFAILGQISLYINRHAEDLRGKFVNHKEKQELIIISEASDRHFVDFEAFATAMSTEVDKYVVDRDLREWFLPAFSTSEKYDKAIASVLLMGSLQKYFGYTLVLRCGLPSVTLLGEKADWENILSRLDKLKDFGYEPTQFRDRLRPVISRFILSFEEPDSQEVKDFWNRIAHKFNLGSGPEYYSGWISAFCFWNIEGRIPGLEHKPNSSRRGRIESPPESLCLDGVVYDAIEANKFPPGYSSVPFKIFENRIKIDAVMLAGSVGMMCTKSKEQGPLDKISPKAGWHVFTTKPDEVTAEKEPEHNLTEQKKTPQKIAKRQVPGSWVA